MAAKSTPGLASLTVINNPPVVDSLLLAPAPLRTADALTATVVASDADGDAVTLDYEWSVNGVVVQSGASNSLASSFFVRGNVVSVAVTPSDANSSGATVMDGLTVENTAPTSPAVSISPAAPVEGLDDLVCTASGSTDADGDSVTYSFAWTVDGVSYNAASTSGATSTVLGSDTLAAELWECTATPNDSYEDGQPLSASVSIESDWAGALTFTNCGNSGNSGPSQSQCDSSYSGGLLDGEITVTSGLQEWVVPASGDYVITAYGAQGDSGGTGAVMSGDFSLTAGDVLTILVGQSGSSAGGGGGSFVVQSGSPLIIAGGGGAGTDNSYTRGYSSTSGRDGHQSGSYSGKLHWKRRRQWWWRRCWFCQRQQLQRWQWRQWNRWWQHQWQLRKLRCWWRWLLWQWRELF